MYCKFNSEPTESIQYLICTAISILNVLNLFNTYYVPYIMYTVLTELYLMRSIHIMYCHVYWAVVFQAQWTSVLSLLRRTDTVPSQLMYGTARLRRDLNPCMCSLVVTHPFTNRDGA